MLSIPATTVDLGSRDGEKLHWHLRLIQAGGLFSEALGQSNDFVKKSGWFPLILLVRSACFRNEYVAEC